LQNFNHIMLMLYRPLRPALTSIFHFDFYFENIEFDNSALCC